MTVPKTKNDQTGEGQSKEKHVYANPLIPEICPILSLAVLFWSQQRNVNEPRQQVFLGLADDARFFRGLCIHLLIPCLRTLILVQSKTETDEKCTRDVGRQLDTTFERAPKPSASAGNLSPVVRCSATIMTITLPARNSPTNLPEC